MVIFNVNLMIDLYFFKIFLTKEKTFIVLKNNKYFSLQIHLVNNQMTDKKVKNFQFINNLF